LSNRKLVVAAQSKMTGALYHTPNFGGNIRSQLANRVFHTLQSSSNIVTR
jgi:hypothetical protein